MASWQHTVCPCLSPAEAVLFYFFQLVWLTGWSSWWVDPDDGLIQLTGWSSWVKMGTWQLLEFLVWKTQQKAFRTPTTKISRDNKKLANNNKSKWSCLSDEWKHVAMLDADILLCEFLTSEPRTNCPGLSKSVLEVPGISSQNEETASEHFCVPLHAQRAVSFQHLDMRAYKWFCQRGHK